MKKIYFYIAGLALMALSAACSEEQFDTNGEGTLSLRTSVSTDMNVVSRATSEELAENCMVWISNEKGLVRRYNGVENIPSSINLVTGKYVAEAWTGDSVSASFSDRWFKGRQEFDIVAGQNTPVELNCKIANVAASVNYQSNLEEVLTDFEMTIGHDRGALTYTGREERVGYFMMPSTDKNLTYELKGKQLNGNDFTYTGVIENARPGTHYILNVRYTAPTTSAGGMTFTIEIDDKVIEVENKVQIVAAPKISGYEFDIADAIVGEKGSIGRRTIYVTSATKINSVDMESALFNSISALSGATDFDLLAMSESGKAALEAAGINYSYEYDSEVDETLIQINFEEAFTNVLENGEYNVKITATDAKANVSVANLQITVSDAPVMNASPENIDAFTATFKGVVAKEGVESVGFNYRRVGDQQWTYVAGQVASRAYTAGQEFFANVTGLKEGTNYEYVTVSGDFVSAKVERFATLSAQLPNNSFEDWSMSGKAIIPGAEYANTFWDTGNHGSSSMNTNITDKSTNYVHSGSYSACLVSQWVGLFGIGKFAAGNIFAGNYLYTDGMDGELGWGRPFKYSPKSVKVWVRYEPGTVDDKGEGDKLSKGDTDQGIIYMALVDDTKVTYSQSKSDFNGTEWSCIVKTKTTELFDKNGANVIAYGEIVLDRTDGDGLVEVTIPLNYLRPGVTPSNVIFVASASRYGDYFQGGEKSTMYLDDVTFIYE